MSNKIRTTVVIVLLCCVSLWFVTILCLNLFQRVFIVPALTHLDYQIHKLTLKESLQREDDMCVMGLRMRSTPAGLSIRFSGLHFTDHKVSAIGTSLFKDSTYIGYMTVYACPDKLTQQKDCVLPTVAPTSKTLNTILFYGNSLSQFIDKMHNAKLADFSWWNLIHDAGLVYVLFFKTIATPGWYNTGQVFRVECPMYSGYLAAGKYRKSGDIKDLIFAKNGIIYQIIVLHEPGYDFKDFFQSIRVVNQTEADEIISEYSKHATHREILLASMISRNVTIENLEELLSLMEKQKSAGKTTADTIGRLRAELEYLRAVSR